MEDIQSLTKPSNIPPVSLEELNDYSEGNKDQWINNHKYGAILNKASDFRPDRIYYLGAKMENPKRVEETIGYIDPYNRGGQVFLPFYKRINVIGEPTTQWEDYTTNFNVGGQIKYAFVFYLGTNEAAEREKRRNQEAKARSIRMMEQMNAQNEGSVRLAEEKRKAQSKERESLNESVNKAPFDSIQNNELGGTRRRRRRSRKLKQSRRSRKLKQSRRSRKLRKSRK
jgi:hypothetical protein